MLSRNVWLTLSLQTREELKRIFNIQKSAGIEVAGNKVVCDGHTDRDLEAITLEALQKELNSSDLDFYKLFNELVAKLEAPLKAIEAPETGDEVKVGALSELSEDEAEKYNKEYKERKSNKKEKKEKKAKNK